MKIIECKYCGGTGKIENILNLMAGATPCPTCGGAGEFLIVGQIENIIPCKFCDGNGKITINFLAGPQVCDVCKGVGIIERPTVSISRDKNTILTPSPPRPTKKGYDIAISFAGEDRAIAEQYAAKLTARGVKVFYDKFETAILWGKDLYEQLDDVYRKQAKFCVIFISRHYSAKLWTNHERKSAQAKAFRENEEYILPIKLDDTELPGIRETVGYIDLRQISVDKLVNITLAKLEIK